MSGDLIRVSLAAGYLSLHHDLRTAFQLYRLLVGSEHTIGSQLQVLDPENSHRLVIQVRSWLGVELGRRRLLDHFAQASVTNPTSSIGSSVRIRGHSLNNRCHG